MIYYADFESGWIGGLILVSAPDVETAVKIANERIKSVNMRKDDAAPILLTDMKKFNSKAGNCEILRDGDY